MSSRIWFIGTCIECAAASLEQSDDAGYKALDVVIAQIAYLYTNLSRADYDNLHICLHTHRGPVSYQLNRYLRVCKQFRDEIFSGRSQFTDHDVRTSAVQILRQLALQLV